MKRMKETIYFLFFTPYLPKGLELIDTQNHLGVQSLYYGNKFLKCFMTVIFFFTNKMQL